jgi:inward rectifier potassium channel
MTQKTPPSPARRVRVIQRGHSRRLPMLGLPRRPLSDAYHYLLTLTWLQLMLSVVFLYVTLNTLFAFLYLLGGDCIQNAEPGNLGDCFFFSVQTLATIGYGVMAPKTTWSHWLVTAEAFIGMLSVAMVTGLMFSKFSRPTARVEFSNLALIAPRNGVPTLMFRMSNQRANQIVEARIQVAVAMTERTQEGESMRRFFDLPMVRSQNMIFALSWTAMHTIDAQSPLFGQTEATLLESDIEIAVSLVGMDETMSQPVHARWSYIPEEIRWNYRFVDILRANEKGERIVDLRHFQEVEPLAAGAPHV